MATSSGPRVLAVMGSGETSPTMVTLHKDLVAGLGHSSPTAVLLETPYGFQANADDISAKAVAYFADSVGLQVAPVAGLRAPAQSTGIEPGVAAVRSADWLFTGPGSPTYALDQWQNSALGDALRDRVAHRPGITVFSSAAACTLGAFALPVYEIYKVGMAPHWRPGLDVLGELGLQVALIPHFDNAEGGTHDTRYCYLGEQRLVLLEELLPDDAAVLGVDEHTALVLDLAERTVRVHGRGGVTVRRHGGATVLPAGDTTTLDVLARMVRGEQRAATAPPRPAAPVVEAPAEQSETLPELTRRCEQQFDSAAAVHDGGAMARVVLELDDAVHAWRADTLQSDEVDRARAVLRTLVVRLGDAAASGPGIGHETLAPAVEALVALRQRLRASGDYAAADALRDALAVATVEVRDAPTGSEWEWHRK